MPKLKKQHGLYTLDTIDNIEGMTSTTRAELEQLTDTEIDVAVEVLDYRFISNQQRKLIFAICNDVESYTGSDSEVVRYTAMQHCSVESLKNCSVTKANKIISELIDFCLMNEIPFAMSTRTHENFVFEEKHLYMLILTRRCVISGKHADIHHLDSVGMGNNRNKVSHIGKMILPLARNYHNEAHTVGDVEFCKKYHLTPIAVDERIEKFIKTGKIEME